MIWAIVVLCILIGIMILVNLVVLHALIVSYAENKKLTLAKYKLAYEEVKDKANVLKKNQK